MKLSVVAFLTAVWMVLPCGVIAQNPIFIGNVPLPEDVWVQDDATLPFSGVWVGKWDNWRNHILVVEGLNADGLIDVVYAVASTQNGRGNWLRLEAKIESDTLVSTDDSLLVRYSISPTGRMRAVFGDNERFAVLERLDLSAVLSSPDDNWFLVGELERLATDLVEDDAPVELATVIYTPRGEGPFPLAVIHHGSTGTGRESVWFRRVWTNDWLADVLNENGYIAAFPQRRGRGGSDGLYDEGFSADRGDGYSSDAAIAIAGADRALEDANAALAALRNRSNVQPGPALLAGVSRGGVVAIMQAGQRHNDIAGVMNFVGGWVSEGCCDTPINPALFRRIGSFDGPVLSIYGEDDTHYSIAHARANIAEMQLLGANSDLIVVDVPGFGKGHWVTAYPYLWEEAVGDYLNALDR